MQVDKIYEDSAVQLLRSLGYIVHPPKTGVQLAPAPKPKLQAAEPESAQFREFWAAYPRKENKAAARKAYNKINGVLCAKIQSALQAQLNAGMFSEDPKYIPMASTWLNQERWENPITPGGKDKLPSHKTVLDTFMED